MPMKQLIQQSNTVPCSLLHSCFKIILLSITCNLRPVFHHDLQPVFCSYFLQLYFILSVLYWARSKQNEIYIQTMRGVHPGEMFEGMQGFFPWTYFFRNSFFSVCLFPFRIFVFTKLLIAAEFTWMPLSALIFSGNMEKVSALKSVRRNTCTWCMYL